MTDAVRKAIPAYDGRGPGLSWFAETGQPNGEEPTVGGGGQQGRVRVQSEAHSRALPSAEYALSRARTRTHAHKHGTPLQEAELAGEMLPSVIRFNIFHHAGG